MSWDSEFSRTILMQKAEQLLRAEGFLSLPVDLVGLAKTRDIIIQPMPDSNGGVSGMLIRHGNTFGILYATRIPNEGFQRSSIAHELGHYFVEGHLDHIPFDGGSHRSRAGFVSDDRYGREADCFAAGLLLPGAPVRDVIHGMPDGIRAVEAIQREARASLTASAIRYAVLTDTVAATIVSRDGKIEYCFMSDAMKSMKPDTWPKKGTPIPPETPTEFVSRLPKERRHEIREEDEIDIAVWIGGRQSVQAREEAVALGSYGRVLTLLTCSDLLDEGFMDEDEDSDEALEKSWTPSFRR